jgi:hypothetical protein
MLFKLAFLMWFVALALAFLTKSAGRTWMARLFVGGFALLLLAIFLRLVSRLV